MSIGTGIVAPVLPAFARTFDVDFATASEVLVAYQIGAVAAVAPVGYLIDRVGRRPLLLGGPVIMGLCAAATAFAGSFPELLVYRFLAGAANQFWTEARLAMIADSAEPDQRARLITWMVGLQRAGMLLGPLAGGLLAGWLGVRWPFVLYGVLTILAVLPSFRLVKETSPLHAPTAGGAAQASPGGEWRSVIAAIMTVQMFTFLWVQFFATLCRGGIESGTLNLYAVYAYETTPEVLGLMNSVAGMLSLPIPFVTGQIMDRRGRKSIIVPGFAFFAASLIAMAVTAFLGMPFEAFLAAFIVVSGTVSVTSGTMQVLGADLAPAFARGRFFSIWRLIAQAGMALSPALFGIVAGGLGYGAAFLSFSATAFAVVLLVGMVLQEPGRVNGPARR